MLPRSCSNFSQNIIIKAKEISMAWDRRTKGTEAGIYTAKTQCLCCCIDCRCIQIFLKNNTQKDFNKTNNYSHKEKTKNQKLHPRCTKRLHYQSFSTTGMPCYMYTDTAYKISITKKHFVPQRSVSKNLTVTHEHLQRRTETPLSTKST